MIPLSHLISRGGVKRASNVTNRFHCGVAVTRMKRREAESSPNLGILDIRFTDFRAGSAGPTLAETPMARF